MRFLRRNQYVLCFVAVLVLSSVLVVNQFMANQSAHVERREDFILLHERAETKATERMYQLLIQELPALSDRSLADDLQRTAMLVNPKSSELDNLVWKYYVSVKNELQKRSERRITRVLDHTEKN